MLASKDITGISVQFCSPNRVEVTVAPKGEEEMERRNNMYADRTAREKLAAWKPLGFSVKSWAFMGALVLWLGVFLAQPGKQISQALEAQTAITRAVEASVAGGRPLARLVTQTDPGLLDVLHRSAAAETRELTEDIYDVMKNADVALRPIKDVLYHTNSIGDTLFDTHECILDQIGEADHADKMALSRKYIDAFGPVAAQLERIVADARNGERTLQIVRSGLHSALAQIRKQIAIAAHQKSGESRDARQDEPGWKGSELDNSLFSEADVGSVAGVISTVIHLEFFLQKLREQAEKAETAIHVLRPGQGKTWTHGFSAHTKKARKHLKKLGVALEKTVAKSC